MKPPRCDLCNRSFEHREGGGLVYFSDHTPLPDGMTGHPDGVEWYCKRHYDAAKALSRLPYADARRELTRIYGRFGWAPAWIAMVRKRLMPGRFV